jgi:hypothetical protein
METSKRVLRDDNPDILRSMFNVAGIYKVQGQWDKAEELETEVMEKSQRMLLRNSVPRACVLYKLEPSSS